MYVTISASIYNMDERGSCRAWNLVKLREWIYTYIMIYHISIYTTLAKAKPIYCEKLFIYIVSAVKVDFIFLNILFWNFLNMVKHSRATRIHFHLCKYNGIKAFT